MKLGEKLTAFALLFLSIACAAQTYPNKPVKVIVSSSPGGSPDTVARLVAQAMSEDLKQAFVVENRVGANGLIATDLASKSPPDGYTLLLAPLGTMAVNHHLYPRTGRDVLGDFIPITRLATGPFFLVVRSDLGVHTLPDLVRHAKAHPGKLTAAVMQQGSLPHLATELFRKSAALDFHSVPYKSPGAGLMAVVSGEVDFMIETFSSVHPQLQTGRAKALAVSTSSRTQLEPSVPTFSEGGVPSVTMSGWIGLFAPKGTPHDVISRLHGAAARALSKPEIVKQLFGLGLPADGMGPVEFGRAWKADSDLWGRLVKESGIRLE